MQMSRANRKHQVSLFEWSSLGATTRWKKSCIPSFTISMLSWKRIRFKVSFSRPLYTSSKYVTIDYWLLIISSTLSLQKTTSEMLPTVEVQDIILIASWKTSDKPHHKVRIYISPTQPVKSEPSQGHTIRFRGLWGAYTSPMFFAWNSLILQELPGDRLESRISRYIT